MEKLKSLYQDRSTDSNHMQIDLDNTGVIL